MRRAVPSAEEKAVEAMPFEKFEAGIKRLAVDEQNREAQIQTRIDLPAFLQAHPEYEDDGQAGKTNGEAMKLGLKMIGVKDPTTANFYQLEEVFNRLKESGELTLKVSVLQQQAQQAVADRVQEIEQEREFNEDDAYSMSLDQLRQRAGGIR